MTTTAPTDGRGLPPGQPPDRERLHAVLALLALLALLVGLPVLLATLVGWPLPERVPTGSELLDAARAPITDRMLVDALACVAWLAWLQIVVCTAIEARAAVSSVGVPRTLPLSGVTQHLTRRLVSSVLLLTTATAVLTPVTAAATRALLPDGPVAPGASVSAPATVGGAAATTARQPVQDRTAPGAESASDEDRTRSAGGLVGRRVLVVEPPEGRHHMSLWEIADTHLGDGLRYKEVFALNEGREQPDGRTLEKARLIQPGWQLLMPDDAVGVPVVRAPAEESRGGATTPDRAPAGQPVAGADAPGGAEALPTAAPAVAGAVTAEVGPSSELVDESPLVSVLAVAEAGLLAAGVLGGLGRLRRVQQRRRAEGERLPVPPAELLRAEVAMRLGEDPETSAVLDDGLRLLSQRQAETGTGLPDVVAAVVDAEVLRLVLATPARPVPAPFTAGDPAGGSWQAPREALRGERPAVLSPYPALVSVGRDDQGALLVDLERIGVLALSGPRRRTTAVLRALALELATSGWADHLRLTLVGFGQELTRLRPDRVRHVRTLGEALPGLEARAAALASRQDGPEQVLASRVGSADPVLPEIVLLAEQDAPDQEELARLRAFADGLGSRRGLALVTAEDVLRARWSLRTDADGSAVVQPLGAGLTARGVDDEAWHAVVRLVDLACAPSVPAPGAGRVSAGSGPDVPPDGGPAAPARLPALTEVLASAAGPVDGPGRLQLVPGDPQRLPAVAGSPAQVRVLGPVEVDVAGAGPAPHPHCVELVALLALHPRGLDLAAVGAALQPHEEPAEAQRAAQVLVARTRAWLGVDEQGRDRLPRAEDGGPLRLGPAVTVDWDLFRAAAASGRLADADLALVRGRPLTGLPPRRGAWLVSTGLEAEVPAVVADATLAEARRRRAAGGLAGAREAAQAGLRADVLDERAWRELLRAEAALGDLGQVAALADQLEALVERELSPYDAVQPETEALLAELLPRVPERAAR